MPSPAPNTTESIVRFSRRSLTLALLVLLTLLTWAAIVNISSGGMAAVVSHRLAFTLPVLIAIAVLTLRSSNDITSKLSVILADELRQASLHRAWRHGFVVMLVTQPVLAITLVWYPAAVTPVTPIILMAAVTAALGALTVLATMLFYDR